MTVKVTLHDIEIARRKLFSMVPPTTDQQWIEIQSGTYYQGEEWTNVHLCTKGLEGTIRVEIPHEEIG